MAVDIEHVVAAAVDSFLRGEDRESKSDFHGRDAGRGRLGGTGALAVGVGLGLAARVVFRRVRSIDLESAVGALEQRLKR